MQSRHSRGSTARIFMEIISSGAGVVGLSPTVAIQRRADGYWLQGADGAWVPTKVENAMTATDVANLPGLYHFDFDQSLDILAGSSEYTVKKTNIATTPAQAYEDLAFGPMSGVSEIGLCSVQGTVAGAQGGPVSNVLIRATLVPIKVDSLARAVQADTVATTYTDAQGDFDLPLVIGGTFRLEIDGVGYDRRVLIPEQSSVLFSDL